jgi:hypothetical protein
VRISRFFDVSGEKGWPRGGRRDRGGKSGWTGGCRYVL